MPLRPGGAVQSVDNRQKDKSHILSAKGVSKPDDRLKYNLELGQDLFLVSQCV